MWEERKTRKPSGKKQQVHRGASPGFDVQRCNPCQPPSCSSLAKGPQHTPGGGGSLEISGFELSFFLFTSKTRFVLSSPTASRQNLYSDLLQDLRSGAMTLATPIDRLSVKARAREAARAPRQWSRGAERETPRPDERPRRATPTSDPDERGQGPFDRYVSPCEASCLFLLE